MTDIQKWSVPFRLLTLFVLGFFSVLSSFFCSLVCFDNRLIGMKLYEYSIRRAMFKSINIHGVSCIDFIFRCSQFRFVSVFVAIFFACVAWLMLLLMKFTHFSCRKFIVSNKENHVHCVVETTATSLSFMFMRLWIAWKCNMIHSHSFHWVMGLTMQPNDSNFSFSFPLHLWNWKHQYDVCFKNAWWPESKNPNWHIGKCELFNW